MLAELRFGAIGMLVILVGGLVLVWGIPYVVRAMTGEEEGPRR